MSWAPLEFGWTDEIEPKNQLVQMLCCDSTTGIIAILVRKARKWRITRVDTAFDEATAHFFLLSCAVSDSECDG